MTSFQTCSMDLVVVRMKDEHVVEDFNLEWSY